MNKFFIFLFIFVSLQLSYNLKATDLYVMEMQQGNKVISLCRNGNNKLGVYIILRRFKKNEENEWVLDTKFGKKGKVEHYLNILKSQRVVGFVLPDKTIMITHEDFDIKNKREYIKEIKFTKKGNLIEEIGEEEDQCENQDYDCEMEIEE